MGWLGRTLNYRRFALAPLGTTWSVCQGAIDELFPSVQQSELAAARAAGWRVDEPQAYCRRCGASVGPGAATPQGCAYCVGQPIAWDRIVRLGLYAPPLSRWIVAMKFHQGWTWSSWLGRELALTIGDPGSASGGRIAVCSVPMHFRRRWTRGYNQAQLIAQSLAKARDWPMVKPLYRRRYTQPQTHLSPSQRPANVRNSFGLRNVELSGWTIWLVDDVKTTGSTLSACAKLLRRAGAEEVNVAVAAVADPKGTGFKNL